MDYKINGLLRHYVLFLALMLQWRSVIPAPTHTSCKNDLQSTKDLTRLVVHEVKEVQDKYTNFHDIKNGLIPDSVPESSISGEYISEKLQDIYLKNMLFYLHICNVEEYQKNVWGDLQSVAEPLKRVKGRLANHLVKIKTLLQTINPEIPLPPTAAPPQLSNNHDYAKKVYGWGVIVRLNDWLTQVLQVLAEANGVCDK